MKTNYKKCIEVSLFDIAFARYGVKLSGGDVAEIDEFISERGKEIIEQVESMNPFEAMAKMLELTCEIGKETNNE